MRTLEIALDGYTDLPPGKIANVVTYMEMTAPPKSVAIPNPLGLKARLVLKPTVDWYRAAFRHIGQRYLWTSRELMSDDELKALLADPATEVLALDDNGNTAGFAELNRKVPGEVEIAMFGVADKLMGSGAGRFFMDHVQKRAWTPDIKRVWLHTCTFDSQAAVVFYTRCGFRGVKFAIEVMDDPRLTGRMPEDAGPHVPVIRTRS
jgi:N-acetylglutamate synthase-like GNAT family acetyltransferase